MGWKKSSSIHRYNSISDYILVLGAHTQRIVDAAILGKLCIKCMCSEKIGKYVEDHD